MKIVITGFAYSRQNFFDVFKFYPKPEELVFILPNKWKVKGTIVYETPTAPGLAVYKSWTSFFNSNLPIFGGLLKGWMPFLPVTLFKLRLKGAPVLYSASEPNLLTTIINAFWAKVFGMKHIFFTWENVKPEAKFKGIRLLVHNFLIRITIFLSDAAICGNSKGEAIIRSFSPTIPLATIPPHGVDTDKFLPLNKEKRENAREKFGYADENFLFLFVGALGYRKGVHIAIEAFEKIINQNPQARFLIVGSGEYESELKNKVSELNLSDFVKFIPWLSSDELPSIYGMADCFLYPSFSYQGWEEQFGYSIAEASACNLPVISTLSGSIEEVVQDGQTGLLVKEQDIQSLLKAMEKIILNQALRLTLGEQGRAFIVSKYSHEKIACRIHDFLEELVKLWKKK